MRAFFALTFAAAAIAQSQTVSQPAVVQSWGAYSVSGPVVGATLTGLPFGGAVIGQPYSATEVNEHIQTLADGTRITSPQQKTIYYRDSQGRTRTEHTFPSAMRAATGAAEGPTMIDLFDPVANVRYSLDVRSRTAHKIVLVAVSQPGAQLAQRSAVAVQIAGNFQPLPAVIPQPITSQNPAEQTQRPQFSREALAPQTMEGILVNGTRMTTTYPVDSIGNDRPVTVTSETWISPDLRVTVLSKTSDPRTGESTTRLTNISRAEPDPSLFQVPPDYQVIEPGQ